jgi:hypothetical protein
VHPIARSEGCENVEGWRSIESRRLDVGKTAGRTTVRSVRDCSGYEIG